MDHRSRHTSLIDPIEQGHNHVVDMLLQEGASPNQVAKHKGTALMVAVAYQRPRIVQLLLDARADPDQPRPSDGATPLMFAAVKGAASHSVLHELLQHGADPNATRVSGETAIMDAARKQHWILVSDLLVAGADPDLRYPDGATVLMRATECENAALMLQLLQMGVETSATDGSGATALMIAVRTGNPDVVRVLLNGSRDYHDNNNTVIDYADRSGSTALLEAYTLEASSAAAEIIRLLFDHGADVNSTHPLLIAVTKGCLPLLRDLLGRGADPNRARPIDGWTPLMAACDKVNAREATEATRETYLATVRLLLRCGADPNLKTTAGTTALSRLAPRLPLTTHQVLLAYGAKATGEIPRMEEWLAARALHLQPWHQPYNAGDPEAVRDYLEFLRYVVTVRSPLEIAVACRLHADARSALQIGRIDARGLTQTALTALANVGPGGWPSAPAVCDATVVFAAEAAAGWSPHTHCLFHPPVRTAVATLFAVAHRQRQRQRAAATVGAVPSPDAAAVAVAGPLPAELWRLICTFVRRPGWAMEQWRPPARMTTRKAEDAEAGDPGAD